MIVQLELTHGTKAIIDAKDLHLVAGPKWHLLETKGHRYAARHINVNGRCKAYLLHRVILRAPKGKCVDHINGDGLDNRRKNLRVCTYSQNNMNQKITPHTSKFKGVSFDRKSGRFQVVIKKDRKMTHLGFFENEKEAARAYDVAAKKMFREFAKTNF